jgi:hypothetical protein
LRTPRVAEAALHGLMSDITCALGIPAVYFQGWGWTEYQGQIPDPIGVRGGGSGPLQDRSFGGLLIHHRSSHHPRAAVGGGWTITDEATCPNC